MTNFKQLTIGLMLAVFVLSAVPLAARADDYAACANLNDYLSYAKCVAEIDSQKTQPVQPLADEVKAKDGEFSIAVGDGSGLTNSQDVVLNLTASAATTKVALARDSNFGFAEKLDFSAKKVWRLEETFDTPQYIYAKFFDAEGNGLKVVAASITLSERSGKAAEEKQAAAEFKKIWGRASVLTNVNDLEAIKIMVYGPLKSQAADVAKERTALVRFTAVYKKLPKKESEWNILKAIAYASVSKEAPATVALTSAESSTGAAVSNTDCVATLIFKGGLTVGSKGAEVTALQKILLCQGLLPIETTASGIFDQATEAAIKQFQENYKLTCRDGSYCGYFGPASAKQLNALSQAAKIQAATAVAGEKVSGQAIFKRNLTVGSQGDDVTKLQKFLAQDADFYPEGKVTGLFGPATEAAVKRFQKKYQLLCKDGTACGYIGPATLKKLNELYSE